MTIAHRRDKTQSAIVGVFPTIEPKEQSDAIGTCSSVSLLWDQRIKSPSVLVVLIVVVILDCAPQGRITIGICWSLAPYATAGTITIGRCWSLSPCGTIGTKRHRQLLERLGSQDRQSDSRSRIAGTNHHRPLLECFSQYGTVGTITISRCWSLSPYRTIGTKRHR